jgi:hypothetical protein
VYLCVLRENFWYQFYLNCFVKCYEAARNNELRNTEVHEIYPCMLYNITNSENVKYIITSKVCADSMFIIVSVEVKKLKLSL